MKAKSFKEEGKRCLTIKNLELWYYAWTRKKENTSR